MTALQSITKATSISAFPKAIKECSQYEMKKATGVFVINVGSIHFTPEWNLRKINREQVEALKHALLNGETVDPLEVEMIFIDEKPAFSVVDGHHTTTAIFELVEEGKHDGNHQATIFKGSELDKVVRAFNSTQGLPLTPLETARAFERMLNETKDDGSKMTRKDVAARTGKSLSFISNSLYLLIADEETLRLVEENKIKASRVGRIMREHGVENTHLIVKAEIAASSLDNQETNQTFELTTTHTSGLANSAPIIEEAEYSEVSKNMNTQGDDNPVQKGDDSKGQLIASKNALKYKSLSKGKVTAMVELVKRLAKKDIGKDGVLELNAIELQSLQDLGIELDKLDKHNQAVTEQLQALTV